MSVHISGNEKSNGCITDIKTISRTLIGFRNIFLFPILKAIFFVIKRSMANFESTWMCTRVRTRV